MAAHPSLLHTGDNGPRACAPPLPPQAVVNPQGLDVRGRRRAWNQGDGRLKFIIIVSAPAADGHTSAASVQGLGLAELAVQHSDRGQEQLWAAGAAACTARPIASPHPVICTRPSLPLILRSQRDKECAVPEDWLWGDDAPASAQGALEAAATARR